VLYKGEVDRRTQSMARGGVGFFNHFWDGPEGLEGITSGGACGVGAGWDLLGGAGASLVCWRGLGSKGQCFGLNGLRE